MNCDIVKIEHRPKRTAQGGGMSMQPLDKRIDESAILSQPDSSAPLHSVEPPKPAAAAFIDYEYWLFSLRNGFHMFPDVPAWAASLHESYAMTEFRFFGDFTQEIMAKDINKIRQVSNLIIETKNGDSHLKKDFTDFIMLDSIYQCAIYADVDVFVLFTGDGHFISVASFLKNRLRKKVVVYGIRDSFSSVLKETASEWHEIPSDQNILSNCYKLILESIAYLESHARTARPSFRGTVQSVAERNEINEDIVTAALRRLMEKGYITQKVERISFNQQIRVLCVDWEKAARDGLWDYNASL